MNKYICSVCKHEHFGDAPPKNCPVCGKSSEYFDLVKKSKYICSVCKYEHIGYEPPEICPICDSSSEFFDLVSEKQLNEVPFHSLSYGLYVISSKNNDKINGMVSNTFAQISIAPDIKAIVSIDKRNYTLEYIKKSKVFACSVLTEAQYDDVIHFGFNSGRDMDKYKGIDYTLSKYTKCPVLNDSPAFFECEVLDIIDAGSHDLIIGKVINCDNKKTDSPVLTYAQYHKIKASK